ncbi:hypothetical protein Aperf_G00000059854 [Anoplocephala perfoliata]
MKIDRKKLANKCGYDQTECLLLAKRLASLPDEDFLKELQRIKVWNYGKCELGLWADVLDRLDAILEDVTTKTGAWTLKVDSPGNENLVQDVVTVLEFTSHLIEHSIYRCLYGSWNHILSLFSSSNMDILLAVLGLTYNFSKRSNYFARLDEYNRTQIHERLSAIAESWGGSEKGFDLASCCRFDHIPPNAGTVTFEYAINSPVDGPQSSFPVNRVIDENFLNSSKSPSEVMEEMLKNHKIPPSKQMTLFSRLLTAIYYSDHEKRTKCIKARLQAISTLCYAFPYDERVIYHGLLDELVDVAQLPDGEVMSIKACALRTMTAIFNLQRANMNSLNNILESTGMANFHGALPTRIRRWIQGLVDGTCDASGGSINQQYTIALLSFLYHLATFEQNSTPSSPRSSNIRTLNSSGIIDSMLQLIGWHVPRNDYLSYVTRAVRVTDQIITSITTSRQILVTRLIERLDYETDLVINPPPEVTSGEESGSLVALPPLGVLNTQRSGLMKSILNLLKRISSEPEWQEIITGFMTSGKLTDVLSKIYSNRAFLAAPHLALFAMEIITTYIYTFPSNLSALQEKGVTSDIISVLAHRPLPAFREFLIQFPIILRSLTLNSIGRDAILTSGVLERYVETLVSKEYLAVMRSRRTRDPPTYSQGNLNGLGFNQNAPTGTLAVQMAQNLQELVRSHSRYRTVIFNAILQGFNKILEIGKHPARLVPDSEFSTGGDGSRTYMAASTGASGGVRMVSSTGSGSALRRHHHDNESMDIDMEVMHVGMDEDMEDDVLDAAGVSSYVDPDVEDVVDALLSGSDGNASDVDHHQPDRQPPPTAGAPTPFTSLENTANVSADTAPSSSNSSPSTSGPNLESQSYILDYILNLSKFMERLHGSGPEWGNSASTSYRSENHRLHSQEGIRVLYDIFSMPGLPYEFPSSYSCAVFAQAILALLNHMSPADVFQPLMNTLERAIERTKTECKKLTSPDGSLYQTSKLLKENSGGETVFLHNLSTLSSILCVVVYLNVHMKSSSRNGFIDIWSQREFLYDLGHLYQEISWEAAVILSMIREGTHRESEAVEAVTPPPGALEEAAPNTGTALLADQQICGEHGVLPRCVEGLSFFKIIAPPLSPDGPLSNAHYVLCVAACFTNSVSELCSTLTSLCTSAIIADRNSMSSNTRRNTSDMLTAINSVFPLASPQPGVADSSLSPLPPPAPPQVVDSKMNIIAEVALFIADTFLWRAPSAPAGVPAQAIPRLQNALQYSAFHLTHVFFEQSHTPNNIILRAFALVGGMKFVFESFSDFLKLAKQRDNYDEEAFAKVLEGMLADVDRLTDFPALKADTTVSNDSNFAFNLEKYSKYLFELLLEPLCLICEADFMKQLTYRGVEFLLNIFKNFVPFIFPPEDTSGHVTDPTNFVLEELSEAIPGNSGLSSDNEEPALTRPVLASLSQMGFSRSDFTCVFGTGKGNKLLEDILTKRKESLYSPIPDGAMEKRIEYLRSRLFNACFAIAKFYNSEQTIQLVAEVILSTNTESRSVKELVKIVSSEFQALKSQTCDSRSSSDLEIALHLLAFFFSRCRFSCVRTFSQSRVPNLLYELITSVGSESTDIYPPRLYALCALLIDQYERSLTALQLRKRSVQLYAGQHTWAWFDESANLWHEHNSSEVSSADKAFHDGIFRGTIQGRKIQTVEFVPMVQVTDTQISRPVLLFPKLPRFGATEQEPSTSEEMTEYEKMVLQPDEVGQEPYRLSLAQRQAICCALLNAFRRGKLDVACSDNFLRLVLRFAATDFDVAETLLKEDVLKVLFNFTPADNWRPQYKALLGHLLRQLFYDKKSLKAKMSEIVGQFFQGSSSLMQWCCSDLFFSLAAVTPLMARNEKLALEAFKEHAELTITDESLKDGNPPRSFLLKKNSKVDEVPEVPEKLNDHQKSIISFLVDRITRSSPPTGTSSAEDATSVASGSKLSGKIVFEKELCLHYLTDLATTSRAVAETLGKSKTPSRETFHSHLFNEGLRGPNSASASNLLVTILFSSSTSTQASVIADFKASLKNILSSYSHSSGVDESVSNNQHIIGLMQFLRTAVNLPPPTQITIIRQFYKRQVPADLAKMISVVNCKVSNGNEALGMLVKVLEVFSKIDSQIIRRGGTNDYQLGRQEISSSGTEAQVSVVSTVADAMMHTATETTQPLASALVPTIVEAGDSIHSVSMTSSATTSQQPYQQQSQPSTQHHTTGERDTWALAEDTSEMGDTTVEDSTAILILDEAGVPALATGTAEIGEDITDNGDEDDSYHDVDHADDDGDDDDDDDDEEEEDISEDHSQGSADEEGEDESDDGHDDDDIDGGNVVFTEGHDDDDEDGDGFDDDAQVAPGRAEATLLHQQRVNLLDNIMGRVFEVTENAGGTSRGTQNRRHAGDERSIVLQFTTISGGNDDFPSWSSGARQTVFQGDRFLDFVTGSSSRYDLLSHGSSFFVGEANGASAGTDAARSIHNIFRASNLVLPTRSPLIRVPGSGALRSVTGGVSDGNTAGTIHLRSLRNAPRRDAGAGSSTFLTLLPHNSRGALARLGAIVNSPILVRTNFGSSSHQSGYLSLAQPSYTRSLPPVVPSGFHDHLNLPRRRRQQIQGSGSITGVSNQRGSQDMSEFDGDHQAYNMLMDLDDISGHAMSEASRNAVNGVVGGTNVPLNVFFSTLSAYRHFVATAAILCGQEVMDMLMLARHEVGVFAVGLRNNLFKDRLEQYRRDHPEEPAESQQTCREQQTEIPLAYQEEINVNSPIVRLVDIGPQLTGRSSRIPLAELNNSDIDSSHDEGGETTVNGENPDAGGVEQLNVEGSATTSLPAETEVVAETPVPSEGLPEQEPEPAPGPSTSTDQQQPTATSTRIPVTDDEIIASMVASGVDPSFLDALPPELRRELMEDHQRSMRVHSTMLGNVPAEVDQTVLASLPPEIQEEVLDTYRNTAAAVNAANDAANDASLPSHVFNTMPEHLRREVLADLEESQLSVLTPELQAEARRLRQAQRHAHIQADVLQGGHYHGGSHNQLRAFGSTMFPAFFGPNRSTDYFVRNGRGGPHLGRGGIRATGGPNLPPNRFDLLMGPSKSKILIDHEGLSCLVSLVIACSSSPEIRRVTYIALKRLIENLCVHASTRRWIISTLLNIIKGLSDTSASSLTPLTSSNASIFGAGFEAPTGCFIQNIQILSPNGSIGIHPQASQHVCFSLLDILYDLSSAYITQFVPTNLDSPQELGDMKTDFWDIIAQLSQNDCVSSSSRKSNSPARTRSVGRHSSARSSAPSESGTAEESGVPLNPYDCYVNIVGLLRHPVVRARPVLQERVISLLVRILDEYHKSTSRIRQNDTTQENGSQDTHVLSGEHVITPLSSSIIEDLCEFVISRNSSEHTRSLATWLIVLMARVDDSTRKPFFNLLAGGANSLAQAIEQQLSDVIEEVNKLSPGSRRRLHQPGGSGDGPPTSGPHIQHSASMTRLPDRLASSSYAMVAGGPSTSLAPPPPAPTGGELELVTLQPLLSMRSEQSRLCRILKLMLYLSSCPEVSLQTLESLSTLWRRLSDVLDCLQETSDENTVLLFQPLVECMCLAHASHTQTAVATNTRSLPLQLQRRAVVTTWTDIALPRSLNMPNVDSQNIIIFNGFSEVPQSETAADGTSPHHTELFGSMSPLITDSATVSAPEKPKEFASTPAANMIAWFAAKHRTGLNHILRHYVGNISESALSVFLSQPKALDFDVKRRFFRQRFQSLRTRSPQSRMDEESIVVSRNRIFEDSFGRLHAKSADVWKHKFIIRFRHEEGQDAGGLLREWYLLMSREIFNPNYALFRLSPSDRVTYTINPSSFVNSNHLTYFEFVGRFIAKAIYDNKLLECYFTRSFYKHILGRRIRFQDLESEDYDFYKGLEFLLSHHVSELNYEVTFCTELNDFGKNETVDLIENGRNIVVTESNKEDYVRLVCQERMTGAIRQQLDAFLKGFYSIIPKSLINIFNEQELELLISGLPSIDINDLRANTNYSKYQPTSQQIMWFWTALESFEHEDRARFLQFVTGTSRVPLGGFANLEGMHGPTKFTISRASVSSTNHLPSAHTCFNTLELPAYNSYEQLRERLLTAIRECSEGYGMA